MDKRSSIFVDKIVISKLLDEKLSRVHHSTDIGFEKLKRPFYKDFFNIPKTIEFQKLTQFQYVFPSPVSDQYQENNTCYVNYYTNSPNDKYTNPAIIFLHGLYDDNRDIYQFLFNNLLTNYDIYLMTLPYHFERQPQSSLFSGEFFWSAKLERSMFAFEQAVYELKQLYYTIKNQRTTPTYIAAFSMGAGIAQGFASLDHRFDGMFLINPVCLLSEIVLDSKLCKTIKEDLMNSSMTIDQVLDIYSQFDPSCRDISNDKRKMCIAYSLYDQITTETQYEELLKIWNYEKIIKYKSGHLNILRVPRLANDIHDYFIDCTTEEKAR